MTGKGGHLKSSIHRILKNLHYKVALQDLSTLSMKLIQSEE